MFKEITLYFDEECIRMFEEAAKKSGVTLSYFLQNAGMVSLLNKSSLPDAGFCIVPKGNMEQLPAGAMPAAVKKEPSPKKKKTYTLKKEAELFDGISGMMYQLILLCSRGAVVQQSGTYSRTGHII